MDPTIFLCRGEDPPPLETLVVWFSEKLEDLGLDPVTGETFISRKVVREISRTKDDVTKGIMTPSYEKNLPIFCDIDKWNDLQKRLDRLSHVISDYARMLNPAEGLDRMSALNHKARAGIKLANIDAIFNITDAEVSDLKPFDGSVKTFIDLAGGPGAFSQYVQYRFPRAIGWGISLKTAEVGCAWNTSLLDMRRFTILEGADGTGNLITNYKWTIEAILSERPEGLDFAVADGFIKSEDYRMEELTNLNLIACEVGIGIAVVKKGGNFVCKVAETLRAGMAEVILLASCAYEKVCLFKPWSSRPGNAELYLTCLNRKADVSAISNLFELYWTQMVLEKPIGFSPLLDGKLPQRFEKALRSVNNWSIERRLEIVADVEELNKGRSVKRRNYDLHRAFILWRIPMVGDRVIDSAFTGQPCNPLSTPPSETKKIVKSTVGRYRISPNITERPLINFGQIDNNKQLITEIGNVEKTIAFLEQQLAFPSVNFFLDSAPVMMNRLRHYHATPIRKDYKVIDYLPRSQKPRLYLPPFYGKEQIYYISDSEDYSSIDLIGDHYLEETRLSLHYIHQAAPMDYWKDPKLKRQFLAKVLLQPHLDAVTLRNILSTMTTEVEAFRPTWLISLFKAIQLPTDSKILDMSVDLGTKMISAITHNSRYVGFTNTANPKYSEIAARLGDPKRHQIINKSFETASPSDIGSDYDLFLVMPLPFYIDTRDMATLSDWMRKFLFVSLEKGLRALKENGWLLMYLPDIKDYQMAEAAQLFLEEKVSGASFEGIVGLSDSERNERNVHPAWIWKKTSRGKKKWRPEVTRSLRELYPELGSY